jgi:hypothetical protein
MTTNTLPAGYELPAELLDHQKALDELVAKAKKTRAAVDVAAAQIPALDAEVQELTAKLAVKDADRYTAEASEVKSLDAEVKKLVDALDSKQRALNRAKNALIVQEARAPEHDEEVRSAVVVLENDLIDFGDTAIDLLRAELLEKVKPLQGVFAAMRVISLNTAGMAAREFVDAAFLPDPKEFNRASVGGRMHFGTNLLAESPEPEYAQHAQAMSVALAPIRASLAAGKALGSYVPLDRRPKPYVRKGYSHSAADDASWRARNDPPATPATADSAQAKAPLDQGKRSLVHRLA